MLAAVAELADALDSGSSGGNLVGVQVPSAAPSITPAIYYDNRFLFYPKYTVKYTLILKSNCKQIIFATRFKSL